LKTKILAWFKIWTASLKRSTIAFLSLGPKSVALCRHPDIEPIVMVTILKVLLNESFSFLISDFALAPFDFDFFLVVEDFEAAGLVFSFSFGIFFGGTGGFDFEVTLSFEITVSWTGLALERSLIV
jgi:hypothetical protein